MAGTVNREFDNAFLEMLGVELVDLQKDFCVLQVDLGSRHLNRQGIIHGGLSATLLDSACGYATVSLDGEASLRARRHDHAVDQLREPSEGWKDSGGGAG